MINVEESKLIALEALKKTERVRILTKSELTQNGFKPTETVWEIDTEILVGEIEIDIVLHFIVDSQFPLEIPKIYLAQECYDKLKYIPHIDSNKLVCTYDSESAVTNPNDPAGVAIECISRAKSIVVDGLSGINLNDFEDEFIAYWECRYSKNDQVLENVISLIDNILDDEEIKLICLNSDFYSFKYVLYKNDAIAKKFISYLDEVGVKYSEENVYFIQDSGLFKTPPFQYTNNDIITQFIGTPDSPEYKEFKEFINSNSKTKLVLYKKTINERNYILGWLHKPLITNIKGFRSGHFKPFDALQKTQSSNLVERLSPVIYTPNRLSLRSSGIVNEDRLIFGLVGLGSIGSNIMFFLNSFPNSGFRLIDKDYLKIENISRHFLGFNYNKFYKTEALKDYYLKKNPLQDIQTRINSVIEIATKESEFINTANYLVVSIGRRNVENWIGEGIKEGKIKIPTFFLWVEPYLCAGHCLYIPISNPNYQDYFEDGLFKFNVISNIEYNTSSKLSLRESGCQTTYTPYSYNNLMNYLSNIYLKIHETIIDKRKSSCSFTWIGDLSIINEMNIRTSEFAKNRKVGELITTKL